MDAANTQENHKAIEFEAQQYAFDDYVLDARRGALMRADREIPLRKQAYEVLLLLVRHPGQLVSKDVLMRSIWGQAVVTENSITQCLREIRHAIDDFELSKIRTVPKRGYIFDLPVAHGGPSANPDPTTPRPLWAWSLVVALAIAAVAWWTLRDAAAPADATAQAPIPPANSIAVLPFMNGSSDPEMAYLADGLSEEILNQLAQLPDLLVIARTSSFALRDENDDIATIGARLNVAHVLEGSLRVQDGVVRVAAQLIDTASQAHRWSNIYERPLTDIFDLQQEIAAAVARELKSTLLVDGGPGRPSSRVPHPEAYQAVLEGQMLYQRRMTGDLERARALFERATELDPDYALAWARLAAAIYLLFNQGDFSIDQALALGAPAARRAVELEPNLAEAQFRAGWFTSLSGDTKRGRAMVDRSFELEPNSPRTLAARAGHAVFRGDIVTALANQRKAVSLDPLSAAERQRLCSYLYHAGEFEEFQEQREVATRLNPAVEESTLSMQVAIHVLDGSPEKAVSLAESVPDDAERHALKAIMAGNRGQGPKIDESVYASAEESLAWLNAQTSWRSSVQLAEVWSFRGDSEKAFEHLDAARSRIRNSESDLILTPYLQLTRLSHFLKPLHDDPRWSQWLEFVADPWYQARS